MSDYNDPNDPANRPAGRSGQFGDPVYRSQGMGTGAWIVGIVVAILVIGAIFWGMGGDGQQTATGTGDTPAATTGQGGGTTGTGGTPPTKQTPPPAKQ